MNVYNTLLRFIVLNISITKIIPYKHHSIGAGFIRSSLLKKNQWNLAIESSSTDDFAPIDRIVFNGGGAKGTGNPGICQALHDCGIFPGIKSISGASVGSLTAAIMAVGMKPDDFREAMLHMDMVSMLNHRVFTGPNIVPGITSSLDKIERFVNNNLIHTTQDFLKSQLNLSTEIQLIYDAISEDDHQLSFGELYLLHKAYPKQFKTLSIPAVALGSSNLTIFDHHKTKNVSIAKACIASSALPILFAPVKINNVYYYDAVLVNPLPSEYFINDNPDEDWIQTKDNEKIILFLFHHDAYQEALLNKTTIHWSAEKRVLFAIDNIIGPVVNTLYFANNMALFLAKCLVYSTMLPFIYLTKGANRVNTHLEELADIHKLLTTQPIVLNVYNVSTKLYTKIRDQYSEKTVLLHTGDIWGNSFSKATKVADVMHALFYLDTITYLMRHNLHDGRFFKNESEFDDQLWLELSNVKPNITQIITSNDTYSRYNEIKKLANDDHESDIAIALKTATRSLIEKNNLKQTPARHIASFFHHRHNATLTKGQRVDITMK